MIRTGTDAARAPVLAFAVALAMALFGAACGDDDSGPSHPAENQDLVEQASAKIERAAAASADGVRDRYIPGPKRYEVVCLGPEEARAKKVGPEFIQCHVEAFSTPSERRPQSVYVESEDWRVPVESDVSVGEPVIVDGYRIRDFLRNDHRLGCSVDKNPVASCKSPFTE